MDLATHYIGDLTQQGQLKFSRWIAEVIRDEWMRQLGEEPVGGFMPDQNVLDALILQYSEIPLDALDLFLRDSIACWIWRTSRNKGKRVSPFFINTHLLADSSLSALIIYRRTQVRSKGGAYGLRVRSEIKMTESKYLAWLVGSENPPIRMLRPSPDWIIASRLFGRKLALGDWEDQFVIHHGKSAPVGALVNREFKRFKQDTGINKVFMSSAYDAFVGARTEIAVQFNCIRQIQLPEGLKTICIPGFNEAWLKVKPPIESQDNDMINFLRRHSKTKPVLEEDQPSMNIDEMAEGIGSLLAGLTETQYKDSEYE